MSKVSTVGKIAAQALCWYTIFWVGKQLWTDAKNKWKTSPSDPDSVFDYEDSPYVEDDEPDDPNEYTLDHSQS